MDPNTNKIINNFFKKPTLTECFNPNQKFFNRWIQYINLVLTTEMKFVDIFKLVRQRLKCLNDIKYIYLETDLIQYVCKSFCNYVNIDSEKTKERYSDNYDEVEERMFVRIELYKNGWNIDKIEHYIYKYVVKQNPVEIDLEYYNTFFSNLMIMLDIEKSGLENESIQKRKGRPSIPKSLKELMNKKHTSKINENMKQIYKNSKHFIEVCENNVTSEELEYLNNTIKNDAILKKLNNIFSIINLNTN
jgi:hypothetical protein